MSKDGHIYQTLVIHEGGKSYSVADERYTALDENKKPFFLNDVPEVMYEREYHFSNDGKWLFVERKLMGRIAASYLYHKISDSKFAPVHFGQLRLDEAAWLRVARPIGLDSGPLSAANDRSHIAGFSRWVDDEAVEFVLITTMPSTDETRKFAVTTCSYNVKTGKFKLLKVTRDD